MIQGRDAIIYFFVDDVYVLYGCASDFTLQVNAGKKSVKTVTSGVWNSYAYEDLGYTISLNGVLTYDLTKFTGWDMLKYQINFLTVAYKITFRDSGGIIRGVAGQIMIESSQFTISATDLVKDSYTLPGTGELLVFEGVNPCDIVITGLTKTGTTIKTINGTYTGSDLTTLYYVLRGNVVYPFFTHTSTTFSFTFSSLLAGPYTIYVYPKCVNDYVGTPNQITFS
ncbi:MAG: hypothetical protein H0X33_14775 [Taibaiella sp.]|nr:hypothetical protein [Taibaiella sp.]